jgi:ABC-type multidrug transport system fused ATPase/permease subunit
VERRVWTFANMLLTHLQSHLAADKSSTTTVELMQLINRLADTRSLFSDTESINVIRFLLSHSHNSMPIGLVIQFFNYGWRIGVAGADIMHRTLLLLDAKSNHLPQFKEAMKEALQRTRPIFTDTTTALESNSQQYLVMQCNAEQLQAAKSFALE